MMESSF